MRHQSGEIGTSLAPSPVSGAPTDHPSAEFQQSISFHYLTIRSFLPWVSMYGVRKDYAPVECSDPVGDTAEGNKKSSDVFSPSHGRCHQGLRPGLRLMARNTLRSGGEWSFALSNNQAAKVEPQPLRQSAIPFGELSHHSHRSMRDARRET